MLAPQNSTLMCDYRGSDGWWILVRQTWATWDGESPTIDCLVGTLSNDLVAKIGRLLWSGQREMAFIRPSHASASAHRPGPPTALAPSMAQAILTLLVVRSTCADARRPSYVRGLAH